MCVTDHRMVGSVRTCPFLGKFPLAQSIGPFPVSFVQSDWSLDGLGRRTVPRPLRSGSRPHGGRSTVVGRCRLVVYVPPQRRGALVGSPPRGTASMAAHGHVPQTRGD